MKVLILDDEVIRHDTFDNVYQNYELYHAYNKEQFERWLTKIEFDIIFFDHDLGISDFSGLDAAKLLVEKIMDGTKPPSKCIVHSWNPIGAENIVHYLKSFGLETYRKPFKGK